jgi:hypothetical protein
VGIFFLVHVNEINDLGLGMVSPRLFPMIVSTLLMILGFGTALKEALSNREAWKPSLGPRRFRTTLKSALNPILVLIITIAYVYALSYLGYILDTFLLLVVTSVLLRPQNLVEAFLISLIGALGTFFLFNTILMVPLPTGIWSR